MEDPVERGRWGGGEENQKSGIRKRAHTSVIGLNKVDRSPS
jgi:hypothetical protein